jgi:hypothetical protein
MVVVGYGSINTLHGPNRGAVPFKSTVVSAVGLACAVIVMAMVTFSFHSQQISLLQDERIPIVSKMYDDTGRYLSPAAIASTAISSHAGTSSDEMAVLEAAAGLKFRNRFFNFHLSQKTSGVNESDGSHDYQA